jgi:ATP-dependent exoDNAse (exonuclease V) beta subunit
VLSAVGAVETVLKHEIMQRAAQCERHNRCRREAPVTLIESDVLLEGFVDLAFEEPAAWTIVDFKTDEEIDVQLNRYQRQVALYADAIRKATQKTTDAYILRI